VGRRITELMREAGLAAEEVPQRDRLLSLGEQRVDEQYPRDVRVMAASYYFDRPERWATGQPPAMRANYQGFRDNGGFAAGDMAIDAMLAEMRPMIRQQVGEERMAFMVLWFEEMSLAEVNLVVTYFEAAPGTEVVDAMDQAA
jgi:hypothetical protein